MILADTNILLRLLEPGHPHGEAAREAIAQLTHSAHERFCSVPHCFHEVYHVLTRQRNGHGKSPEDAAVELRALIKAFPPVPDSPNLLMTWVALVARYRITGRLAYDAKIVAAMIDSRIPTLLTFNDVDFQRFSEIAVLNPFDVLGQARS